MRSKRKSQSIQKNLRKNIKLNTPKYLKKSTGNNKNNKSSPKKDKGHLICNKNQFLAVRSVEGSFYLCRAKQLVYENLNRFLIQWLEEDLKHPGIYDLVYFDHVEPECLIDVVKLVAVGNNKFQLAPDEEGRILALLRKKGSIKKNDEKDDDDDNDDLIIDDDDDDDDDGDEEEEEEEEEINLDDDDEEFLAPMNLELGEPVTKKPRRSLRVRHSKPSSSSSSSFTKHLKAGKKKATKIAHKDKYPKNNKELKRKIAIKNDTKLTKKTTRSHIKLKPRPDIHVLKSDPLLHSREKVPFLSTLAHSKLVMRAICLKDMKLLESYVKDTSHISELNMKHSSDVKMDALRLALRSEHLAMVQLLARELGKSKKERVKTTESMMESVHSGSYNPSSLGGIPYIREVAVSRGCREGNNAFTKAEKWKDSYRTDNYIKYCLEVGVKKEVLDRYILSSEDADQLKYSCFKFVHLAIRMGHRKLAGAIVTDCLKTSNSFNILHSNVLLFDGEHLQAPIREASVKKMAGIENDKITPIHCAAINPDPYYLSTLLSILPEPGIVDASSRKPIHYAAACVGVAPLELLLDRNQNPDEPDKRGMTALMIACECGRSQNVDLILKRASDINNSKYGPSGINRPNMKPRTDFFSYTPIHIAVHSNSLDCIEVLLSHGANVERELGASENKSTPLMLACSLGHLEVVELLLQADANPEKRDKIKRTPLMYACKNGHAHIVSFLLNLGCDPDAKDSSGNTSLQYAAAYGWYFCVKLLLGAGCDPNLANDWKMTPLALAYLKGHIGLADLLLQESSISINFRMEGGVTLVMMACTSHMTNPSITDQLEYLVINKKADCSLVDGSDKNALHHLAVNKTDESHDQRTLKTMTEILLKNGCNPSQKDVTGLTPLDCALQNGNLELASYLIQNGSKISDIEGQNGENIFHSLARSCCQRNVVNTLKVIVKNTSKDILAQMILKVNNDGYCPLLLACREYWNYKDYRPLHYKLKMKVDLTPTKEEGEDDEDDDDDDIEPRGDEVVNYEMLGEPEDRWSSDQVVEVVRRNCRFFLKLLITAAGFPAFSAQVQPMKKVDAVKNDKVENDDCDDDNDDDGGDDDNDDGDDDNDDDVGNNDDGNSSKDDEENPKIVEEDKYRHSKEAKFTILHYLSSMKTEKPSNFYEHRSVKNKNSNEDGVVIVHDNDTRDNKQILVSNPSLFMALKLFKRLVKVGMIDGSSSNHMTYSPLNLKSGSGLTSLMEAVVNDNKEAVLRLLKFGADVNCQSSSKWSLFKGSSIMMAAKHGSFSAMIELLKAGGNLREVDLRTGCTPLHFVIMRKPSTEILHDLIKHLLQHGAPLDVEDGLGQTPLHKLAKYQRGQRKLLDCAKLLLDAGASLSAKDKWQRTPLHICMAHNQATINTSTKLEELFISRSDKEIDEKDILGRMPLHYAYMSYERNGRKHGTDPTSLTSLMTHRSRDLLTLVNAKDHKMATPLHLAACIGAGVSCIHLMQKKSDPEAVTSLGNTPLALAVSHGHSSCALLLFLQNCNLDKNIFKSNKEVRKGDDDNDGGGGDDDDDEEAKKSSTFDIKCDADCFMNINDDQLNKSHKEREGKKERRRWSYLPRPEVQSSSSVTSYPIIEGIFNEEWQGIISMALELNQKHSLTLSTMIVAAFKTKKYNLAMNLIERSKTEAELVVREKMEFGSLVSSKNLAHLLAEHSVEASADESIMAVADLLVDYKVSFSAADDFGCTPLHYACLSLNMPLISFIIDLNNKGIIIKKDNAGRTAMAALFWRHVHRSDDIFIGAIKKLMSAGLTIDFCCRFPTPRHAFMRFGEDRRIESLDYFNRSLIIKSINHYSITNDGIITPPHTMVISPLTLAVMIENEKLVKVLVNLGAEVNIGDGWGRSPLMYALALNNMSMMRHLLADHSIPKNQLPHVFFNFVDEKNKQNKAKLPQMNSFQLGFQNITSDIHDEDADGGDDNDEGDNGHDNDDENSDEKNDESKDKDVNIASMDFPPILLNSKVDLNHVDKQGHPLIHYLVPFQSIAGTIKDGNDVAGEIIFPVYDNHVLLLQLCSLGAKFDVPDRKGLTLKERACEKGCQKLIMTVKYLEEKNDVISAFDMKPIFHHNMVNDNIGWPPTTEVNPGLDARSFLDKFEVEDSSSRDFESVPDENMMEAKISQVTWDDDLKVPYDVLLFKIDVKYWQQGLYNFYKMQIVYQKSKDLHVLFTRWGRIGDRGQYQQTPFQSRDDALKEFKKIFKSKSGNLWENYHSFEEKHLKYRLVSLDNRKPPISKKHVSIDLKSDLPSKLHPAVVELIRELTNISSLKKTMDQTDVDTSAVAFGRINKDDLDKAKDILQRLLTKAGTLEELRMKSIPDIDAIEEQSNELADLSNEYYHILPRKGYQYEKVPILNHKHSINKELSDLDLLFDLELTTRFMMAAMEKKSVMNPFDYIYRSMDCRIVLMEEMSCECQLLLRYITSSWAGKVEAVFKIERKCDRDKFADGELPMNRKLLFHGSNSANLISILTRGLLISPPGVQFTGNLFGSGIYLADTFSKSVSYCYNHGTSKVKFMLICEADLGRMRAVVEGFTTPPEGVDSILALGNEVPDPIHDVITSSGAVLPLGKLVQANERSRVRSYTWLNYNEYVLYSTERVALRYVIQFKD